MYLARAEHRQGEALEGVEGAGEEALAWGRGTGVGGEGSEGGGLGVSVCVRGCKLPAAAAAAGWVVYT